MTIHIRPYQPSDWEAVCDVHDRARPLEIIHFMPVDEIQALVDVYEEDGFFDGQQFVAEQNGKVVGFVCVDAEELTWLYVDPNSHRQGIGRLLFEHVKPIMGDYAHVLAVNPDAIRFYEKMGYQQCAEFPGYIKEYPCTCTRLAMPGSPRANIPPKPGEKSLRLAGYDESDWGTAVRGPDGVWRWQKSQ
ncbi:MAG: GNAT family N-acetyltransferase [Chloroflexota bacterium]